MRFATISRIQLIIFILFLYFLNSNTRYPNKRNNLIFRQLKTTKKVWINTKIEKPYTILLSLKTTNETTTQTETNKTETNKTVDSEITEEKIESIIKEQNAILRDEMGKSKLSIKQELNRSSTEFNSQLNKSTIIVKTLIKNNHKKIKNALRKLEFQIKETSKENDDVASTILSKEISEKEEMFKELKKEIENLNQSMPIQLINKTSNSSCFSYFNCRECTKDINCGWCDLQQACVDGDELGPLFEVCSFYSYKKCNDNDCNNYNSCEECINNPFCGWCKDLQNNVEGCLNNDNELSVCPKEGWIQVGTTQNMCEFADNFKKADFLYKDIKMSHEEKKMQIMKKKEILAQKENLAQNITLEISDLNNKLDEIKSHYVESDKYSIDNNDEVDEFETVDYNLLNKTKLCDDISQNKTISEGNTTNEINYESSFMGNQLEE